MSLRGRCVSNIPAAEYSTIGRKVIDIPAGPYIGTSLSSLTAMVGDLAIFFLPLVCCIETDSRGCTSCTAAKA